MMEKRNVIERGRTPEVEIKSDDENRDFIKDAAVLFKPTPVEKPKVPAIEKPRNKDQ